MTKLQLLHRALNERLMAAVEQIMEMVGGTVLEYEEETIRVRKENEVLRRRLRWLEGATSADWPGPSEPVMTSIPEDSNPSQQDENTVNCGFEENSGPVVIKTELTDHPLHVRPESADQGSENAGTSTGIAFGLTGSMTWDSAQNYMAPLDFDPSSGISRFRDWRERNRRQRMSFACLDCGKVFGREQGLIFHMRIHSKDRPYMYRQRKACFYGDKRKKRKLHRLSQLTREVGLSREAEDDLSDGSEQTNRSSASPDRLAPGQEDEGLSESDCSSSGKEAKKLPLRRRRPGRTKRTQPCVPCYCPHCPGRVFSGPGQLGMHMKSHRAPQNQGSPTQSSTNKTEEATRTNIPQKQSKSDAGKKNKCAGRKKCPCPRCGKVFFKSSALRLHIKDHENDRPSSQENLDLAVQTEPPKEEAIERKRTAMQNSKRPQKTFSCPVCNKVFTREGWLEPHIRSQHGAVNIKKRKYNKVLVKGKKRRSMRISKGPDYQTTSTDDNATLFKINHCFYCKQPHYNMMAHLQSVHPNEPKVAEALIFDKNSQQRDDLLKHLQIRGNALHNTNLVERNANQLQPYGLFASDCPVDDSVYCIYCLGLFNKKSFATHLEKCKGKSVDSSEDNILQFKDSTVNEDCFEIKENSQKPSTGPELTDWNREELSYSECDKQSSKASTWDTSFFRVHPENDAFKNICEEFSPPHSDQSLNNDTSKSSPKARTFGTRRKRRKNQSQIPNDGLLGEGEMANSKVHVCQHCKAAFSSPYTLRRHEYTHTGDVPSSSDQEKLKRAKRRIPGGETSVEEEMNLEPTAIIPERLADAVNDDTAENIQTLQTTEQDTEAVEFHWEADAGHGKINDSDTDCWKFLFTS
ncbi:uncharacterized protein isoform X3 [Danio rerio]|uniref:Uncharacterized protein isoform X3 n=1 Tax=Danio rerio TaxID=7955 RepID=A0AC58IEZ8_DANRE